MNDVITDSLDETGPSGRFVGDVDRVEKTKLTGRYLVSEIERPACEDFELFGRPGPLKA